jgi:hypothetical protein
MSMCIRREIAMKKTLVITAALGVLAFTVSAQPRLKVMEGTKFDLGNVDRGVVATKHVTLKNIGNQVLTIGNVEVSCGCTGTVVSSKELNPGDTTSLLITFNSKNFTGQVHKSLTINSNSADAPRTLIEFTAKVVEDLSFTPLQFYFKDALEGRKSTATVKVTNGSTRDQTITGYRTQLESFVLKYPSKPIRPGETVELSAEFTPKKVMPVLSDGVYITTSSQSQPEVYVYIFGNVKEFRFE